MKRFCQNIKASLLKKRPTTFLEQIDSALLLSNIFGCVFFNVKGKSVWRNIVIALPVQMLYAVSLLHYVIYFHETHYHNTEVLRSSDFIYLTVILATSILQPLYFFTRRNRHRELILKMEELHQLVNPRRRSGYNINYPFVFFSIAVVALGLFFILIFFRILVGGLYLPVGHYGTNAVIFTTCFVNDFIQFLILKEKRNQYESINESLRKTSKNTTKWKMDNLRKRLQLIVIYSKISASALDLNSFLNPSILLNLSIHFVLIVWMADFLFVSFAILMAERTIAAQVSLGCFWRIVVSAICLLLKLRNWVRVTKEAQKTVTNIHDIWNYLASKDEIDASAKHLQLVALQLYNSKLSFTAYGFFALDWTLLHKIISAVATYVVILIQFEVSSINKKNVFMNDSVTETYGGYT